MTDPLDQVLELVAQGRLTASEAEPILAALGSAGPDAPAPTAPPVPIRCPGRQARIEVTEEGRAVVNLRVPLPLGTMALDHIPGLSGSTAQRIRDAVARGIVGPILEIADEDGDGVRVVIE